METHLVATDGLRESPFCFAPRRHFTLGHGKLRGQVPMPCKACQADTIRILSGEIALHVPGLDGLDMPIVWVFPKVTICLSCGVAEFQIPERELQLLQDSEEG